MKLPKLFTKDSVVIAGHHVPLALIAIVVAVVGIIMVRRAGNGLSLGTAPAVATGAGAGTDFGSLVGLADPSSYTQPAQIATGVPDPTTAVVVSPTPSPQNVSPSALSAPSGGQAPAASAFALPAAGTTSQPTMQPAVFDPTTSAVSFNPIEPRSSGTQAIGDVTGYTPAAVAGPDLIAALARLAPAPPPAPRATAGPSLIAGIQHLVAAQAPSGVLHLSGRAGGNVGLL